MCAMGFKLQLDYLLLASLGTFFSFFSTPFASLWLFVFEEWTRSIRAKCKNEHTYETKKDAFQTLESHHMHCVYTQINITMPFTRTNKKKNEWRKGKIITVVRIKDNIQFGAVWFRSVMELFSWIVTSFYTYTPHTLPLVNIIRFVDFPVSRFNFRIFVVIWHLHTVHYTNSNVQFYETLCFEKKKCWVFALLIWTMPNAAAVDAIPQYPAVFMRNYPRYTFSLSFSPDGNIFRCHNHCHCHQQFDSIEYRCYNYLFFFLLLCTFCTGDPCTFAHDAVWCIKFVSIVSAYAYVQAKKNCFGFFFLNSSYLSRCRTTDWHSTLQGITTLQ